MKPVSYQAILRKAKKARYDETVASLTSSLINLWLNDYDELTAADNDIVEFSADGFSFLYDLKEGNLEGEFVAGVSREPRIVAAFGSTQNSAKKRNNSRQQSFIGGFRSDPRYKGYDKGHFISHKIGGVLEQNLFPQKTDVNCGISEEGKRYIAIEKFCQKNEGIFMFSRPIYSNSSWIPSQIEIGYLTKSFDLVFECVSN